MDALDIKVYFTGSVDEKNVRELIAEIKNLNEKYPESDSLTVYISSFGGSVDIAVELYSFLKLLDCKVRTVNTSCVNSAANIIFAAGTERISLPDSSFYIHSVSKEMSANTEKIASILSSASNKNKTYWKRLMRKGCLLTSKKAKELGLVNDISEYENKAPQMDI